MDVKALEIKTQIAKVEYETKLLELMQAERAQDFELAIQLSEAEWKEHFYPTKSKGGRPKGAKNKPKIYNESDIKTHATATTLREREKIEQKELERRFEIERKLSESDRKLLQV